MRMTMTRRDETPASKFGMPKTKGFPMTDALHDRLAIGGATRAFHAGNISREQMERLQTEARAKLQDAR